MHVLQSSGDLVDVGSGLGLGEADFRLDRVEEVAASREILHHHVRGLGLVSRFVRCDDERVFRQVLAVLELLFEAGSGGGVFADGLDGHFSAGGLVFCNPGGAVSTLAGWLDEGVALVEAGLVVACICHFYWEFVIYSLAAFYY